MHHLSLSTLRPPSLSPSLLLSLPIDRCLTHTELMRFVRTALNGSSCMLQSLELNDCRVLSSSFLRELERCTSLVCLVLDDCVLKVLYRGYIGVI